MASFYDVVHRRRDVRGEFIGGVVPTDVLCRILTAAHSAPSVGLSQPWDFILVRDMDTRTAFRDHVQAQREIFANQLDEAQAKTFARIKVEGVLESSLGIVVTYDPQRGGPAVLGRHAIDDAGLYWKCAWRSDTFGWPRPPRGSVSVGSASPRSSSSGTSGHPHRLTPPPTGGLAVPGPGPTNCRRRLTSSGTAGDTAPHWPRSCMTEQFGRPARH